MSAKATFYTGLTFSKLTSCRTFNLNKILSTKLPLNKRFYSSVDEKIKLDTEGKKSFTTLNPGLLKDADRLLLANSRFFCQDKPLLGVNRDGSFNSWSLLPHLSVDQLDPKTMFSSENKKQMEVLVESHLDNLDFHPLISRFDGDAAQVANDFFDQVLQNLTASQQPLAYSLRRHRSSALKRRIVYRATSVLRKRRLKMNKHKYRKLRKRTRYLRKRLGK
ncbi:hypothetical protein DSO57_1034368 [Entomophthora muscae]|uniref:Uncharacterized protein n=1 Tax=Entomophthora muscae TaxID=34485 RepID=A0ACC2U9A5_9FUNG|nr:hypothetical protein DSO57_1034368 [Entomophthora muscae]